MWQEPGRGSIWEKGWVIGRRGKHRVCSTLSGAQDLYGMSSRTNRRRSLRKVL